MNVWARLLGGGAALALAACAQSRPFLADPPMQCTDCDTWNRSMEPFRVFGNTYHVGTEGLGAVLITSDAGHVLIDGGLSQSAPVIHTNIRALGFDVADIRAIAYSHAHFDHVGGIAALQRASGARVWSSPEGKKVLETGESIAKVAALPCDIILAAHPGFVGVRAKLQRTRSSGANAFIDSDGCSRYAADASRRLEERVAKEQPNGSVPPLVASSSTGLSQPLHITFKRMADGKQWMTQNLDVASVQSYCHTDAELNCQRYGRLYAWESARQACDSLEDGWRLPTDGDWRQMARYYGGVREDSKDTGQAAYRALLTGGSSGFNAVLGGSREDGQYSRLEAHGFYWTASESASDTAWFYNFGRGGLSLNRHGGGKKDMAASVRCVRTR